MSTTRQYYSIFDLLSLKGTADSGFELFDVKLLKAALFILLASRINKEFLWPVPIEVYLLVTAWVSYVVLHSLLATNTAKRLVEKILPAALPYYRLFYNLVAAATILPVLWLQFSLPAADFYPATTGYKIAGYTMVAGGIIVIIAAFFWYPVIEFAGLDVFRVKPTNMAGNDELIVTGLSKQVRHPLYLGLFLIAWGLVIALPRWPHLVMAVIFTAYIYIGLRIEERRLIRNFGEAYLQYRQNTPFLFPWRLFFKIPKQK